VLVPTSSQSVRQSSACCCYCSKSVAEENDEPILPCSNGQTESSQLENYSKFRSTIKKKKDQWYLTICKVSNRARRYLCVCVCVFEREKGKRVYVREREKINPLFELPSLASNFPMQPKPRVSTLIDIQLFPSPSLFASAHLPRIPRVP
jgi:hypothetical protein